MRGTVSQFSIRSGQADMLAAIANMEAWAEKDYFVGYEIALKYVGGTFQESVDFVKSAKSKCKGHGGWYIGSDLPTGYFEGQRTVSVSTRYLSQPGGNGHTPTLRSIAN